MSTVASAMIKITGKTVFTSLSIKRCLYQRFGGGEKGVYSKKSVKKVKISQGPTYGFD